MPSFLSVLLFAFWKQFQQAAAKLLLEFFFVVVMNYLLIYFVFNNAPNFRVFTIHGKSTGVGVDNIALLTLKVLSNILGLES